MQTFVSSDTASMCPRRELRSAWLSKNTAELSEMEEHKERQSNLEDLLSVESQVGKPQVKRKRMTLLVVLMVLVCGVTAALIVVALKKGEDADAADFREKYEYEYLNNIPNFNLEEFEEICAQLAGQTNIPTLGGCFSSKTSSWCASGQGGNREVGFCADRCECPKGILVVITDSGDLCNPHYECPLASLKDITQAIVSNRLAQGQP